MSTSKLACVWLLSFGASGARAFAPLPPNLRSGTPPVTDSPTSLAMGGSLFGRVFRIVNSNVNKALSSLEDPEKILNQSVTDMQSDLIKIRQAYAEATASQRRMQRQKDSVDAFATDWYKRANLALQRGNDRLAKEALSRRQAFLEQSQSIDQQIEVQKTATDKLYSAMLSLEGKIQDAAAKKQQLVARAKTAKSTAQVNDMLSGLTGKTSMDAFNRMEDKVEALEAAAEASAELSMLGGATNTDLETEFQLLEASSSVDDELERMKLELNLLGPSTSNDETSKSKSIHRIPIQSTEKVFIQ